MSPQSVESFKAPRVDLFTTVHKALRALIYHLSSMLQTADYTDERATKACLAALEHFLELLHEHAMHEDRTIFAETHKFEPAMIDELEKEHHQIDTHLDQVHKSIARVQAAATDHERIEAGDALNRSVNDFIAFYLGHLSHEESTVLPATWKHFNDEQLIAMRLDVQRSTPPARFAEWMRWMFPAMNINELVGMFKGLKAHAPQPFYEAMCQVANVSLGEVGWRNLQLRAGL
jgi:hemerythrin-like domain-containing protein